MPGNNLLCDLITSLQGLTPKASVENGTWANVFWPDHLNFAQQKDTLLKPAVCCCSWHVVATRGLRPCVPTIYALPWFMELVWFSPGSLKVRFKNKWWSSNYTAMLKDGKSGYRPDCQPAAGCLATAASSEQACAVTVLQQVSGINFHVVVLFSFLALAGTSLLT